ncbi:hypothetical protein BAE44_0009827 [Dichanthelium oligosanthes]|uniref:F-box domain-containing protein n=1 Tax=Dichanthelium oligosanthes TaxID=888268 RepID=A0A1E5VVQ7_9POAL|nr:hypothetical protein BAE44_0009827 [Dichanthelium oligosanthes]
MDVVLAIFHKLDHIDILVAAGGVCSSWHRVARDEPSLWCCISMHSHPLGVACFSFYRRRVCRSAGQCEAFCGDNIGGDRFLTYRSE